MANPRFNAKHGLSVGGPNSSTPVNVIDNLGNFTPISITTPGIYENNANITANYSITAGNNALSSGPITVNTGVFVTVPSGSVWTII